MRYPDYSLTCYDVIGDLDAAIRKNLAPGHQYYLLGGVPTGALMSDQTVHDRVSQTVVARGDSAIPILRDNGTRRDLDVLVNSGSIPLSEADARKINGAVQGAVGDKLVSSVFGFDAHKTTHGRERVKQVLTSFTSSRTVDEQGIYRYELFPVEQVVPAESYHPWRLQLPGGANVQIFHPAAHMLAYEMRSITGVRPKDAQKYGAMALRVAPEFREELRDGQFASWREFVAKVRALRSGPPASTGENPVSKAQATWFRTRAGLLSQLERHEQLVQIVQAENNPLGKFINRVFAHNR